MIDIETLGTKPGAAILSIGAVVFNPMTGKIGEGFYTNIAQAHAAETREVDDDTLKWWKNQSEEARNAFHDPPGVASTVAADQFLKYLSRVTEDHGGALKPWGNGSCFDITILEDFFRQWRRKCPWGFWNVRDVRTIVDICHGVINHKDFKFAGTAHNALDDAIHQAKYVSAMWRAIKNGQAMERA